MHSFHIAVPTAFHVDLSLDCKTTLAHIRYLYQQGVRAVMVCGSTGEQHSLTTSEKLQLLAAIEQADLPADLCVIFGVAHPFYREAVELAMAVEKNTAVSAILLAAPPYIRPNQQEFHRYVERILAVTLKPIILYNNPARTGFDMATETLLTLSQHPQIIGVKDPSHATELVEKLERDWLIFAGGEENLAQKLERGFNALSSIAGNVMPQDIQRWYQALLQNPQATLPLASGQILSEIYNDVALLAVKQLVSEKEGIEMQHHRRP